MVIRPRRSQRGMLARRAANGFNPCAVVETSAGNFQARLKQRTVFPKLLGTFAAQTSAERYDADPSAADWRRLDGLPALPTANLNTESRTASSLSCACTATADNRTQWQRPSSKRSRRSTKPASRNIKRGVSKVLFRPEVTRGCRLCRLRDSAALPNIRTTPPR